MRWSALVMLVLLQGCATQTVRPLKPYEIATAPYRFGEAKPVVGSLLYEGGCLLFRTEGDLGLLLPVWPAGTKFEESLVTFHEPGRADQRLVIGEEVQLDALPVAWASLGARFDPFRNQCRAEPVFITGVTPAN